MQRRPYAKRVRQRKKANAKAKNSIDEVAILIYLNVGLPDLIAGVWYNLIYPYGVENIFLFYQ